MYEDLSYFIVIAVIKFKLSMKHLKTILHYISYEVTKLSMAHIPF